MEASIFVHLSLIFLLFSAINVGFSKATPQCPSSSCGHLLDIHHPFRLKTDPSHCGSTEFELTCESNKPYFEWESGRFYVVDISYLYQTINVVDPVFMNQTCKIPNYPFHYDYFTPGRYLGPCSFPMHDAYFLNCSEKMQSRSDVPCTSGNGSYLYVTLRSPLNDVQPSCQYINSTFVSNVDVNANYTTAEVFDILQSGFPLCWYRKSVKETFGFCLKQASRYFIDQMTHNGGEAPKASPDSSRPIPLNGNFPLRSSLMNSEMFFLQCVSDNVYLTTYANFASENTYNMVLKITPAFLIMLQFLQLYILLMIIRRFIFMPFVVCVYFAHKYRRSKAPIDSVERFLREQKTLGPVRYSYTGIIAITRHFKEKLGEGGFGSVFKGKMLNNQFVAVKMIGNSTFHGDEFINEVSTLGWIHHRNIVQLLGYCSEGTTKALVYEYMPNGSLDRHIFSTDKTSHAQPFSWDKLREIALGVARGIDYLHRECDMQILHFDIKPHNVLLDENFVPKISDFGLAKLYPKEFSIVSLSIAKGTMGYVAPEVISRNFGVISHKSDVYSFGMLLLEMARGKRHWNTPNMEYNKSKVYNLSWIYDQIVQLEMNEISTEIDETEVKLCKIGLWCIQMKQSDRPAMIKVVEMLEGDGSDSWPMPPKPFLSSPQEINDENSTSDMAYSFSKGTSSTSYSH